MDNLFDEDETTMVPAVAAEYTVDKDMGEGVEPEATESSVEELAAEPDSVVEGGASEAKFSEQLTQLEGIVAQLESGQLDLEDSLKRYEEGVQLIRSLQIKLVDAEQKVQVMMGEIEGPDYG